MRLTIDQRQAIVDSIQETFGAGVRTWLFGSRTDDQKFGGDIDLLVETSSPVDSALRLAVRAVGLIQRRLGDQKIDLVVTDGSPEREDQLIIKNARRQGVLL